MPLPDGDAPALATLFHVAEHGIARLRGVHLERGDEIRIEGRHSSVILDSETFEANDDEPIVLRPTAPVPFLRLAA